MVELKLIALPAQIVVLFAVIEIVGTTGLVTVMVIELDNIDTGDAHVVFEVIKQVIILPLASVVELNVEEFVPTLVPLIFH